MTNEIEMQASVAPKRKKIASLDRRKARSGWLFILPFLIGFALIYVPMLFDSIKLSFSVADGAYTTKLADPFFINYQEALFSYSSGNQTFIQVLVTGLQSLAFDIPAILIFSLFMAVMLNQKMAGRAAFRAIFFIPVVISTGIMETVASSDINSSRMEGGIDSGEGDTSTADSIVDSMDLEMLFSNMKVGTEIVSYVTSAINNIFNIVNRSGVQMLIFLAALQGISPAIYESCKIDGATAWETFWKITFPMISPMILVNGVYTIIDSFTRTGNSVMNFISNASIESETVSSAMSWIYFTVVILIVAAIAGILSAFVFYQRKND